MDDYVSVPCLMDTATCIPPVPGAARTLEPMPMLIGFKRNDLDRRAQTFGEAAGKPGVVHHHPETNRSPARHRARPLTARPPDEVEARTRFVGAVHSQIGRCEFAEGAGRHPRSACSFSDVDGGGIVRYPG